MTRCNHLLRPIYTAILVFTCVFLHGSHSTIAADLEEIKKLDKEVLEQKDKITRVKKGIRSHQTRVAKSKSREISLLAELEKIDQQIQDQSKKLIALQEEMNRQDRLTREKHEEMESVLFDKETLREHTEKRLAAYYRMGDIGIMNVTFSSSSLPELLSFRENFHLMLKYDHQVITAYKNKVVDLDVARKAHAEEKKRLDLALQKVQAQQKILAETKLERRKLLARVKTERKLYEQAIQELNAAAKQLASTLTELEADASRAKEEREMQRIRDYPLKPFKKRRPASARGFASQKGKLPLPAAGAILQKFGKHTDETFGVTSFTNGIDIESAPGSDVIAVFDGKVVYAGTLRGYGKLIIIDHGNHFFSLVSGVGEIMKNVGDRVKQHDKIGVASLHSGLLREGLHFEIRHNTQAQDPLEWLDPALLSFKQKMENSASN